MGRIDASTVDDEVNGEGNDREDNTDDGRGSEEGGGDGSNRDFNNAICKPLSHAPRFTKNSRVSNDDPRPCFFPPTPSPIYCTANVKQFCKNSLTPK